MSPLKNFFLIAFPIANQSACYVNGEAYLEATGASDLSISTNFVVLLGFMVAGAIFSFVSMRAAIHKKSKQG